MGKILDTLGVCLSMAGPDTKLNPHKVYDTLPTHVNGILSVTMYFLTYEASKEYSVQAPKLRPTHTVILV